MARLIYSVLSSLDGYTVDASGRFDWAAPDEQVHAFVNELERPAGTYLYGRGMYEVMRVWQAPESFVGRSAAAREFARIWQGADKIVYSTTLAAPSTPRTRVERSFDPQRVEQLKAELDADISIGGPTLAAHAVQAGLVDEFHQILAPVVVGGGTPWLPTGVRLDLELVDERAFDNGMVHLHYRRRAAG